jgi:DNA repair exonuclease SbcCD nuclease subunit
MAFEGFRRSFDELLSRATRPEERRAIASRMKDTLVQARLGLDDLRDGLAKARQRLANEERELETVRRRKQLAEGIKDRETTELAAKYEQMHAERAEVLRRKVAAQEEEVALAEREMAEMSAELKAVLAGGPAPNHVGGAVTDAELGLDNDATSSSIRSEIDALGRQRDRADREADAARRLDELKRKMGK